MFLGAGASPNLGNVSISLPRTWEQVKEKPSDAASFLQYSFSGFILDLAAQGRSQELPHCDAAWMEWMFVETDGAFLEKQEPCFQT